MDAPPHIAFMIPEGGSYTMGGANQDQAAEWAATGAVTLEPRDLSGEDRRRPWPYYCDLSPAGLSALIA